MQSDDYKHLSAVGVNAHHLLVVDDDREAAEQLKASMESLGHRVTLAKDGGQAHSAFQMRKPDFVILDVILPGESGFEICEHMKQINDSIPVLLYTEIDMDDARNLAERVGADGLVTKPCEAAELKRVIEDVAERNWQKQHDLLPKQQEDGAVKFHCECGTRIKVKSVHRGRTMTCPSCQQPVVVPRYS